MMGKRTVAAACAALAIASACAGPPRSGGRPGPPTDLQQNIALMLTYDENKDGKVTRDELEQGLKRQFDAADTNHDGVLDITEVQAENDRRYIASKTGYSPLIDWNQDAKVDFNEFATTARSVLEQLDRDHNGILERDELRVPPVRRPGPPRPEMVGPF